MRKLYSCLVIGLMLSACSGAGDGQANGAAEADTARWQVAVLPTMDCLPLMLADAEGYFAEEGVSVGLRRYQAQLDIDTALLGGSVVAGVTDLARVEHLRQQGLALSCVTATDAAWQLYTMRTARISKLVQLDDKMMAMTRYSATDMLSDLVVDSAKLKSERVFRIQVNDLGVRLGMLQSGIMDAMFLPEPQATAARNLKAQMIFDTRKAQLFLGCIAFAEDSLKGHDGELKALLRAYDRAVDSLNTHGIHAYNSLMEAEFGVPQSAIDSLPADLKFRRSQAPREADVSRVKQWWEKRVASMKYVEKRYLQ